MKGTIGYYKIFFYILELVVSNAQILMSKSTADAPIIIQLQLNLIEQLVIGRTFRQTERLANHSNPFTTFALLVITFTIPLHLSQG